MNESYFEFMIKRKKGMLEFLIRLLSILLFILAMVLSVTVLLEYSFVGLIIEIILGYGIYFAFRNTSIEFEYIYLQGECQVDKILGHSKRKGCGKIEMEKVEIVAPDGSELLEKLEQEPYRFRDFTSHEKDARVYAVFQRNDASLIKVIFEPNDDILEAMEMAAPRKVHIKK